jgi:hypothetical protein
MSVRIDLKEDLKYAFGACLRAIGYDPPSKSALPRPLIGASYEMMEYCPRSMVVIVAVSKNGENCKGYQVGGTGTLLKFYRMGPWGRYTLDGGGYFSPYFRLSSHTIYPQEN